MMTRASLILVASFFIWVIADLHISGQPIVNAGGADLAVQAAGSAANTPSLQLPPTDTRDLKQSSSKSVAVEPLLLLVLGSTLFSLGTAINLIVRKKFKGKLASATTGKSPTLLANALQRSPGR